MIGNLCLVVLLALLATFGIVLVVSFFTEAIVVIIKKRVRRRAVSTKYHHKHCGGRLIRVAKDNAGDEDKYLCSLCEEFIAVKIRKQRR